jgi:hypothetical protein
MRLLRWSAGLGTAAMTGLTLLAPAVSASAATSGDPEFNARLHGSVAFRHAFGHSEYERTARHREVEVTVNNLPARLRGHRVTVFVAGRRVGTMLVNRAGHASREWKTERGQFVPLAGSGSPCRVRTSSGTLIVSGRYVLDRDE